MLIAVVVALLGLVLVPAPAGEAQVPTGYVALGDSFTAGPLVPSQSLNPLGCLRSSNDYPAVVARQLGLALRDVSCSGAQTRHMTESQGVTPGPNAPQFSALRPDTAVVTLGIGGNDIGFSGIVQNCATINPFGRPCRDDYVVNGVDELRNRIAATGPRIAAVIQGIRARSPQARIFVVGYPAILPETNFGCWPVMPLTFTDVGYLRGIEKALNTMLANRAAANGARYVDTYTPSIGRDACKSPTVRWVEPILPANPAAPVHPNARGLAGMGTLVANAIRAS
ncbi:MAG TPA: SGNH/GDSL hydrolase family protein [Acidimicrobiales bacterium]|nr:SGNH/GDSL hydrolase family protein [Acidimicrobiales bacterium]